MGGKSMDSLSPGLPQLGASVSDNRASDSTWHVDYGGGDMDCAPLKVLEGEGQHQVDADSDDHAPERLRAILVGGIFALLRMKPTLETAFRSHYREFAANVLKVSIYGMALLYLLVIVPIWYLGPADAGRRLWLFCAVYPVGVVLVILWAATLTRRLNEFVELILGGGLYLSLLGTIYCALTQAEPFYCHIAAYESIFIIIIGFSVLRLFTQIALTCAVSAFVSALALAWLVGLHASWLDILLFFCVPVLICSVNGLMLEFAARRDFIQTLQQRQEKHVVLRDIAAAANETDDINSVLNTTLRLLCEQRDWMVGLASLCGPEQGTWVGRVMHISKDVGRSWFYGFDRLNGPNGALSLAPMVQRSEQMMWSDKPILLPDVPGVQGVIGTRMAFPVKLDKDVVAVLEFFSHRPEPLTENVRTLMDQVAHQISRVFSRLRRQQELLKKTTHDQLTGLPNRTYLVDRISAYLARAYRRGEGNFAILLVDVDHFKWVNESVGHEIGDLLLIELGQRLRRGLRPSDMVGRLGSDGFLVIIDDVDMESGAVAAAERILEDFSAPMELAGHVVHCSASIGIVNGGPGYPRPDDMLRDAHRAVENAKERGRGGYVVFSKELNQENIDRLRLINELQDALYHQQLMLYYQPIVNLADGVLRGFEALIRWQHPEQGLIGPGAFIPVAEESSLIIPITRWAIREACSQLARWQVSLPANRRLSISVNMCAAYFSQETMPEEVLAVIRAAGIPPQSLRLEITETHVMNNIESCMRNISVLREQGVYVYIDDFGTGYSSLSYLSNFSAKALKIDRSFVGNLGEQDSESAIVRTISLLGQHLNMEVIAEGIETEAQLRCLQSLGCTHGQGYLFARPVPADVAAAFIGMQTFFQDESKPSCVPRLQAG